MSATESRLQLEEAYRELLQQWEAARASWQDAKAAEFEQRYLAPLRPDLMLAMEATRELGRLIEQAREACA
jgi:hypothetical protein